MALHNLPSGFGKGGAGFNGDAGAVLAKVIKQLQSVKTTVVTGNVGANADMTLTGVAVGDTIISVIEQTTSGGALATHAGTVTVTATNTIRSTDVTTGKNLVVTWAKARP